MFFKIQLHKYMPNNFIKCVIYSRFPELITHYIIMLRLNKNIAFLKSYRIGRDKLKLLYEVKL